ncbi:hypothetical protein NEH16_14905 [Streptomyces drozdowiczii]|uniref:OmpR/PhoB-type domain-containing protein n=1 Tax=Streptomyces drozdowiczii TaxID=202862 RepID=A0ABY6PSN4_9ACTN|nr:hypothetical protein [Streptomyces drozdowiczii]UZK55248.1 hypothetical protein NEH16_14905 [Streptomyces drozdowiczii]
MRYLILGATEARDENGGVLPLGGSRLRALLAALALRPGRPVPVADLVDDVWADDPPPTRPPRSRPSSGGCAGCWAGRRWPVRRAVTA